MIEPRRAGYARKLANQTPDVLCQRKTRTQLPLAPGVFFRKKLKSAWHRRAPSARGRPDQQAGDLTEVVVEGDDFLVPGTFKAACIHLAEVGRAVPDESGGTKVPGTNQPYRQEAVSFRQPPRGR